MIRLPSTRTVQAPHWPWSLPFLVPVRSRCDGHLRVLPPTAASHVYRIVQEGLTNVNKHAHAGQARVVLGFGQEAGEQITPQRRWLALTIEDDGCRAAENGEPAEGSGLGLIGIRERVMALGGTLDVIDLGHAMIPFEAPAELAQ